LNSKAPPELALAPSGNGAGDKTVLQYLGGIGKIQPEDMARGKYLKSYTQRVIEFDAII
jgi:hypothetical protein